MRKTKAKSKKRSSPLKAILFSLIIIGAIAYYAVSRLPALKPVPIEINEVSVSSGTVLLSLPASVSSSSTTDTSAPITITTGSSKVSAAQIEISYDGSAITAPTVALGDFLSVTLVKPKVSQGKITFVLAATPESGGKSGTGTLATLKFRSLNNTSSALTFTSNTMVAAVGSTQNALKSAGNATIQIAGQPAPTAVTPTTPVAPTPASPSQPKSAPSTPVSPASSARVFNSAGNFDYSKTAPINAVATSPVTATTPSAFARFLAFIRSIFGGK